MRLTQAQLAEQLEKAVNTYQAYEDGRVIPKPETLDKMADIFKCSPIDLYADPNSKNEEQQIDSAAQILSELRDLKKSVTAQPSPLPPAIREIVDIISAFDETQLGQALSAVVAIRNSAARRALPKKALRKS